MTVNSSPSRAPARNATPQLVSVSDMPTSMLADRMTRTGKCCGANDDLFFPEGTRLNKAYAARLCAGCPAQLACLEFALRTETGSERGTHGIWGGTIPSQRREMIRARRERQAAAVAS